MTTPATSRRYSGRVPSTDWGAGQWSSSAFISASRAAASAHVKATSEPTPRTFPIALRSRDRVNVIAYLDSLDD